MAGTSAGRTTRNSERMTNNNSEMGQKSARKPPRDDRPVILQMEVLISQGQVDYVVIHKGDNIEEIVQKFAQQHALSSTKQNKLLRLVQ